MPSQPSDLHFLTIAEASRLIAAKQLSPVELTQAFLDRIEALDPQLDAFILLTAELAREQAQARPRRRSRPATIAGRCTAFRSA